MPPEVLELMKLYPQPVQQSGVEFLPIEIAAAAPRPQDTTGSPRRGHLG